MQKSTKLIVYKIYTQNLYKMYAKFRQNFFIQFVYKIKRTMTGKICIQNV